MEIRVEQTLTGEALLRQILSKYGDREALASRAKRGDSEAWDDLIELRLLEERPERRANVYKTAIVTRIQPKDIEKLSQGRLQVLAYVCTHRPKNVRSLAAGLGRDKKNVSEDVQILARYGMVRTQRHGREKLVEPAGTDIRIKLPERTFAARGSARGHVRKAASGRSHPAAKKRRP